MGGFQKAQRRRVYIKLALTGPSGSGKTFSALRLAFGLGTRVAMLDSENGSGSLYAHLGEYDVMEIDSPFSVQKYVEGIREAADGGYDVLIIDSLSHAWAGDGGLLSQKESLDSRGGNPFSNWAGITKQHEQLKSALLQSPLHIIATIRSKTDYVMQEDRSGKAMPRKVGLAPIQRDGIEYEFSTVFDVAIDHSAVTSKDRTGLFDGLAETLTEHHGRRIKEWLESGVEVDRAILQPSPEPEQPTRVRVATPAATSQAAGTSQAAVKGARTEFLLAAEAAGLSPEYIRNVKNLRQVAALVAPGMAERSPLDYSLEDWRFLTTALLLHRVRPGAPPLPGQAQ
jgi:hypothetical protein